MHDAQTPFEGTLADAALAYARLHLHVFPCKPDQKVPLIKDNLKLATVDEGQIRQWWAANPDANIGIAAEPSGLIVVDVDPKNGGDETFAAIQRKVGAESLDTLTALTPSGGQHLFFEAAGYNVRSGVNALGAGVDIRAGGGYVVSAPSKVKGREYRWEVGYGPHERKPMPWSEALDALRIRQNARAPQSADRAIPEGSRNATLFNFALAMARNGLGFAAIHAALREINEHQCQSPLAESEVASIARSASNYVIQVAAGREIQWEDPTPWPELSQDALHGFAGDIVRVIEPHTEADPVALLATALTLFGNAVGSFDGKSPYVRVGAVKHPPRIYSLLSGDTAKARKGQSYSEIRQVFASVCDYLEDAEVSGLSTGEGLINKVRDPKEPKDEDDVPEQIDRRVLVHESEFARVLTAAGRTDCTLSPVLRDAWDTRTLHVLTRNSPLVSHDAYISIVAHVTQDELVKKITDTDITNGLLNRFLLMAVKRSKLLPNGGFLKDADVQVLSGRLKILIDRANRVSEVVMSLPAAELWDNIYRHGFKDEKGLVGAAVARAEAHTLRLSLIYALMDEEAICLGEHYEIQPVHIKAAYALWQYVETSTKHIFGKRLGDPTADRLLSELRDVFPNGLDFTQQRDLFGRHAKESQLNDARMALEQRDLIQTTTTPTKGRPKRVSFAVPPRPRDQSDHSAETAEIASG